MKIYIDCEWNGFGGELISMALVSTDNKEFYEVLECANPCSWVADNVIPILNKDPISPVLFKMKLAIYLAQFERVTIISDWPENIAHFCRVLITGPGERLDTPGLTMQIIRIDAESTLPHNALADARGIKKVLNRDSNV